MVILDTALISRWTYCALLTALMTGLASSTLAAAPAALLRAQTTDGQIFKLSTQRGHVVIINYWATWCAPCLDEMPMLRNFAASHSNVRLIGLTYEDITPEALRQFVAMHHPGYAIAHIDPNKIPRALKATWFGIHALPMTYVVSPEGMVAKPLVGELSVAKLQKVVGQWVAQETGSLP